MDDVLAVSGTAVWKSHFISTHIEEMPAIHLLRGDSVLDQLRMVSLVDGSRP
jgi:hypothetical protein